jgi:UDP-GlcNAc:undecaprenyl-phosphate GlcNAc-1-phosphate transferase
MLNDLARMAATFALAATVTWAVRELSYKRGWLAQPRADRTHTTPTALFGGVAIFIALAAGLLVFSALPWPFPGLMGLTAGMFLLGLADDIWELRPQTKLVAQIAAGVLLYLFGFHFNDALPRLVDLAIVVFWVVGITNAMNLLDNMNGLCAGTAAIAIAFRWLFFVSDGNLAGAAASATALGAVLGFLVFNFPRASIFMGDAGSLVIGFYLAALNLTSGQAYSKGLFSVLFFPVLVLAIPIFDTAFVSVVRAVSGRAVSLGGRDHASHRLVAVGLSETAAVLVLHGISIAGGITAFVFYQVGFSYAWFSGALLMLALLLFGIFLASVRVYPEDQVPAGPAIGAGRRFRLVTDFTYKRVMLWVLVDTITILVAWYVAFLARHGQTPNWTTEVGRFTETAPIAAVGVLLGLSVRGLYRTDWQHMSLHELRAIVSGTVVGLGLTALTLELLRDDVSRRPGMLAIAFGANVMMLAGSRVFVRTLADLPRARVHDTARTLIYGAGKGGELAVRELRSNLALRKEPAAFLDDDPLRKGMTLHGLPVLGGIDALEAIIGQRGQQHIDAILVSTGKLMPEREARLAALARAHSIPLFRLNISIIPFEPDVVGATLSHASEAIRAAAQVGRSGTKRGRVPDSIA